MYNNDTCNINPLLHLSLSKFVQTYTRTLKMDVISCQILCHTHIPTFYIKFFPGGKTFLGAQRDFNLFFFKHIDARQSDLYVPPCFAGDTIITCSLSRLGGTCRTFLIRISILSINRRSSSWRFSQSFKQETKLNVCNYALYKAIIRVVRRQRRSPGGNHH